MGVRQCVRLSIMHRVNTQKNDVGGAISRRTIRARVPWLASAAGQKMKIFGGLPGSSPEWQPEVLARFFRSGRVIQYLDEGGA